MKVAKLAKYVDVSDEKKIQRNCANIALKFNLKCGGTNKSIADGNNILKESKTMVVGIHITPQMDPSPKKSNKPSKKNKRRANQGKSPTKPSPPPKYMKNAPRIVSMVANSNHTLGQWPGSLRSQASDIDKPQNLDAMIIERLEKWKVENNGSLPKNILVYRSGASEGQYESILREEFTSIERGCAKIYSKHSLKQPKISIIIVTKLHDSSFAALEGDSKLGTFVERNVAKAEQDFALQASIPMLQNAKSHKSKALELKASTPANAPPPEKATPTHTRPTRYVIVRDDMEAGVHALETIVSDSKNTMEWGGHACLQELCYRRTDCASLSEPPPRPSRSAPRLTTRDSCASTRSAMTTKRITRPGRLMVAIEPFFKAMRRC